MGWFGWVANDKNGRNQNGRRPIWKTTKMEDDQYGRRPIWKQIFSLQGEKQKTEKREKRKEKK